MKTIKIQGKDYTLVSERIIYFNEKYPKGCIETDIVSDDGARIVMRANIYPDGRIPDPNTPERCFTGYAEEVRGVGMVNKTSAVENCETSAVGRALGMMGIGVIEGVASADEMVIAGNKAKPATDKQIDYLTTLLNEMGTNAKEAGIDLTTLTTAEASVKINSLSRSIKEKDDHKYTDNEKEFMADM